MRVSSLAFDLAARFVLQTCFLNVRLLTAGIAQTVIEINGDVKARATASSGKRTELYMYKGNLKGSVESVKVVGREELTNAELGRDEHLLLMLQGEVEMDKSLFVRIVWFPKGVKSTSKKSKRAAAEAPPESAPSFDALNESQRTAAIAMVGNTEPFFLTRGA